MNMCVAKIVYRIVCGDADHTAQFDVQLQLAFAPSEYRHPKGFVMIYKLGHRSIENRK